MNSKERHIQKTSGTHKVYKPGQLVTICKDVFRIRKNTSAGTQSSSIGEKQSYTSKQCFKLSKL